MDWLSSTELKSDYELFSRHMRNTERQQTLDWLLSRSKNHKPTFCGSWDKQVESVELTFPVQFVVRCEDELPTFIPARCESWSRFPLSTFSVCSLNGFMVRWTNFFRVPSFRLLTSVGSERKVLLTLTADELAKFLLTIIRRISSQAVRTLGLTSMPKDSRELTFIRNGAPFTNFFLDEQRRRKTNFYSGWAEEVPTSGSWVQRNSSER